MAQVGDAWFPRAMVRVTKLGSRRSPADRGELAPDFGLFGVDTGWQGERHLDLVEAQVNGPPSAVWLAHTKANRTLGVRVGTAHRGRPHWPRRIANDAEGAIAARVALAVFDMTIPRRGAFLAQGARQMRAHALETASNHYAWPTVEWIVDDTAVSARVWHFAGAWGAFTVSVPGVYVLANGIGVAPEGLRLVTVDSSMDYGLDLRGRLPDAMPGARERDSPITLIRNPNPDEPHADHLENLRLD